MTHSTVSVPDVVIVGGGIVGICCANFALERGLSVTVVDREPPASGASYGNAGVISPWSCVPQSVPGIWVKIPGLLLGRSSPLSIAPGFLPSMIGWGMSFLKHGRASRVREIADAMACLTFPSVELYKLLLDGSGEEELVADCSYLHAFREATAVSLSDLGYAIRKEKGADMELLDQEALQALEPGLSDDFTGAVVIRRQARALSPGRIGEVLLKRAVDLGAQVVRADVSGISRDGKGWRAETSNGTLHGRKLVLAAGAWSGSLLKGLGVSVPLVGERGYHVEFPKAASSLLRNSVMDLDRKVVASSMECGLRIAGTAEFAALDAPENPRRYQDLIEVASGIVRDLDTSDVRCWMGRRPSFPDSLPVLGEIDGLEGLFGAFGHSHYGFMMAPKTGQLIGDLLAGVVPNVDLRAYRADRFR